MKDKVLLYRLVFDQLLLHLLNALNINFDFPQRKGILQPLLIQTTSLNENYTDSRGKTQFYEDCTHDNSYQAIE